MEEEKFTSYRYHFRVDLLEGRTGLRRARIECVGGIASTTSTYRGSACSGPLGRSIGQRRPTGLPSRTAASLAWQRQCSSCSGRHWCGSAFPLLSTLTLGARESDACFGRIFAGCLGGHGRRIALRRV